MQRVEERLRRIAGVLKEAGIPYAVVGGNAVAHWVARVDEAAVRNTRDVDILIRRDDLPRVIAAAEAAGFVYRHVKGIDALLEGADAKFRDAVHLLFAEEQVRPGVGWPTPDVAESVEADGFRVIDFSALVRLKLDANRRKDQVHLLDMIELGMIGSGEMSDLPPELRDRLQELLDDPDG